MFFEKSTLISPLTDKRASRHALQKLKFRRTQHTNAFILICFRFVMHQVTFLALTWTHSDAQFVSCHQCCVRDRTNYTNFFSAYFWNFKTKKKLFIVDKSKWEFFSEKVCSSSLGFSLCWKWKNNKSGFLLSVFQQCLRALLSVTV